MTETLPDITDAFVEQVFALVWAKQRQAEINPLAIPNPPGHVVVAPGQTIGSDWGNAAWDQCVNRFASVADRDTQWTTPPNGALAYTAAEKRHWRRVNGAWQGFSTDIDTSGVVQSPVVHMYFLAYPLTTDGAGVWGIDLSATFSKILAVQGMASGAGGGGVVFSGVDLTPATFKLVVYRGAAAMVGSITAYLHITGVGK